jgi:hypothetical protein
MYQVADLLPEKYRGVYSDFSKVDTSFFHFQ